MGLTKDYPSNQDREWNAISFLLILDKQIDDDCYNAMDKVCQLPGFLECTFERRRAYIEAFQYDEKNRMVIMFGGLPK